MKLDTHFTLLVYPFVHAVSGQDRNKQLRNLDAYWQPWWGRLLDRPTDKPLQAALDDTYFFLPSMRTLLFPETHELPLGSAEQQLDKAKEIAGRTLEQFSQRLRADGVLRLTYRRSRLLEELGKDDASVGDPLPYLTFMSPSNQQNHPISICLHWVDVALFPDNIGFLLVKVHLAESTVSVDELNVFHHHVRFVLPPKIDHNLATWKAQAIPDATFMTRDLVDFFLQGLTTDLDQVLSLSSFASHSASDDGTMRHHLIVPHNQVVSTADTAQRVEPHRYSVGFQGQVYGQKLHLYCYASRIKPDIELSHHEKQVEQASAQKGLAPAEAVRRGFQVFQFNMLKGSRLTRPNKIRPQTERAIALKLDVVSTAGQAASDKETTDNGLFSSAEQRALYELATSTDTSTAPYKPHPLNVKHSMSKGYIALWANWQGLALRDNTVFLATPQDDDDNMVKTALPSNVENDYFPLYLLVLFQHLRLSTLSSLLLREDSTSLRERWAPRKRVLLWMKGRHSQNGIRLLPSRARHIPQSISRLWHKFVGLRNRRQRSLQTARRLWDGFVRFRNHYWLAEVTNTTQGSELYQQFRAALNVEALYASTSEQVRELQRYYEEQAQRRLTNMLGFVTTVGLPLGILVGIFNGIAFQNAQPWLEFVVLGMLTLILSLAIWFIFVYRRRE